jgi:predicted enzyme related to lactoylglutathione lyase
MPNPVIHFEIVTKEPEKLATFYREMFDWDVSAPGMPSMGGIPYMMARPYHNDDPPRGINGGIGGTPEGYGGHVTFYVYVDDVGEALAKIEKLGGTRMMGPEQLPGLSLGLFRDPQGNTIGLVHPEM